MKEEIKEIPVERAYRLVNHGPVVIITSFDGENHNGSSVAWITPLEMDPPLFITSIANEHKTFKNIVKTKEAVINVPTVGQEDIVMYLGTVSGNKVKDKLKDIETEPSKYVKPLRIKGCIAWIETKLQDKVYISEAEHELLILKACGAFVREDAITRGHILNVEKYPTLHHLGSNLFGVVERKVKGVSRKK